MLDWLLIEIPVLDIPLLLVVLVVGVWMLLRSKSTFESSSEMEAVMGDGEPVVLNFFGKL